MTDFETQAIALLTEIRDALRAAPTARTAPPAPQNGDGPVFPNYGRSKGQSVRGATAKDLEFYRAGCVRTLDNPEKERWHAKERTLLAAIDEELARQGASAGGQDAPPPREEPPFWGNPPADGEDVPF